MLQFKKIDPIIYMDVISGNAQFSYATCHIVYLELGLDFRIWFQSHTMLRLRGVAESEVSD